MLLKRHPAWKIEADMASQWCQTQPPPAQATRRHPAPNHLPRWHASNWWKHVHFALAGASESTEVVYHFQFVAFALAPAVFAFQDEKRRP